ncbi:hypothetical protein KUTeg_011334 [Tegillarca granosa]|uniref:Uncharacterized protein n=1 Tax=Tegillarca granosa TaxID=220873 RepID=A0ABQ9F197_TEGGR|nr:hypothetical protein KUTeg_011334 [Tegillarca granosa]
MLEKLYARYARLIASDDIVIVIMPKHFTCCRCHKRCKSDPAQRRPVQSHLRTQTENDLGRPLEPGDVICSACRRRLARIKDLAIDVQHQHKDTIDPDYQPPAPFSASIIKSPKSIQLQINSTPRNHKNCVICKKPSGHRNHHVMFHTLIINVESDLLLTLPDPDKLSPVLNYEDAQSILELKGIIITIIVLLAPLNMVLQSDSKIERDLF